jgi:hypothetical protein
MDLRLHHDAWGRLVFTTADGVEHVGVDPVRAFPISEPSGAVSILTADGQELAWIECLTDLPLETRRLVEDELAKRHFLPTIERIAAIAGITETAWTVHTDRGQTRFTLKSEEDVRRIAGTRIIITDGHGIRYLIPDYRRLDAASLRLLERYI